MYVQNYLCFLNIIFSMLQQYGAPLGLMVPSTPNQIALPGGIKMYGGLVVYYIVVMRSRNFNSKKQFINDVQTALNQFCYQNTIGKIHLMDIKSNPDGSILMALCM